MDIKITDKLLRHFLDSKADPETLSQNVSLCGPTFDHVNKVKDDFVYDIEVITNRVDTASALGVAREASVILNLFNIPAKLKNDPYLEKNELHAASTKQFHFDIDKNLVDRFTAISFEKITVAASPTATADILDKCGQRPINNLVDITNELTLLYGLPTHVFDLDKLAAQKMTIRESLKGEAVVTLDGLKNNLAGGDIVIEDGSGRLVDLCGVMGGQIAEVDEHTKNALFIVPVYSPKKIRKTSLYLQKRTLAAQIYEKQADPELCIPVLNKAVQLIKERTGGIISSPLFDFYPGTRPPKFITLDFTWLNSFIGVDIKQEEVISILAGLGFSGTKKDNSLICSVPSWRYPDINIKEDLAEEVARIYGYFRLPGSIPQIIADPEKGSELLKTESDIKDYLSAIGYHEIYNNSLVSELTLKNTTLDPKNHLRLANALSSDFEYLRTTLAPSLLENLRHNQGKVEGDIRIFEISNVYCKQTTGPLPAENSTLAFLSTKDFRSVKGELEALLAVVKISATSYKQSVDCPAFFQTAGTATIYAGSKIIGYIGLIKPEILLRLDIHSTPIAVELDLETLSKVKTTEQVYEPISEFPMIREDITINSDKPVGEIIEDLWRTSPLVKDITYLESFNSKHTFKVSFGSQDRNLEQREINIVKEIIQKQFVKN